MEATGAGVEAAATASTSVHGLQEEAVSRAAARKTLVGKILLVKEVLHLLVGGLMELGHKKGIISKLR